MKTYWTSAIIWNESYGRPWLLALASCQFNLEKAMEEVTHIKTTFHTLSAWIDMVDENNNKQTVFHECYVNAFGDIDN